MIDVLYNVGKYVVLPIAGVAFFVWYFIKPNIRGWKERRMPTYTTRATVIGREQNSDNVVYSSFDTRDSGDVFLLQFRTENHGIQLLRVPRDDYYLHADGATGELVFQGNRCWKFTPDPKKGE